MANKRYLKDARTRALKARRKKAKNGMFMQRAQQGQFAQQTPYLLNQLNQMGQPGYTFNHGSNMTSEQAAAQSAQMQGRMDQMNPQGQQQAVPQMPGQNPMAMGIQPPPTAGAFGGQYGFNSAQENPNDNIVAAGKQASGVADMEAAAPKIDPGQVAETVTPKLAEAGTALGFETTFLKVLMGAGDSDRATVLKSLAEAKAKAAEEKKTGGRVIQWANPQGLVRSLKEESKGTLGRKATKREQQQFVKRIHNMQAKGLSVNVAAEAEAFQRQSAPVEAAAMDMSQARNSVMKVIMSRLGKA